eukprot:TRINITY_DN15945_c0_g1_i1.p1 TRINITY_DN15945_c0_g1~~TRINITY_DN15945_c0_g1_i1.p1  ORF type:complete len:1845 (+),score=581.23 TRINITY_DN15945_c0_g1_i1:55-5535(+)
MPITSPGGVVYSHNVFDPARPVPRRNSSGRLTPEPGTAAAVEFARAQGENADRVISASASHQEHSRLYLPRLLGNDPTLVELDLRRTDATDVSTGSIADALRANTTVTALNLRDNLIESAGAHALADCLMVNSALIDLDLRGNGIDSTGCAALANAMRTNTTLRTLRLEGNPLLSAAAREACGTLVALNGRPPALKSAVLAARVGGPRVIDLSAASRDRFRDVDHDADKHLDCWAACVLAHALIGNRCVEELILSNQHVQDLGARALADMLRQNERLDRLNLFGNAVTDSGAEAFCSALEVNNTCTVVNLKANACGEDILWDLEKCLALNRQPLSLKKCLPRLTSNDPDLIHLRLDEHASCRHYDDVSARLLSDVLPGNDQLTALDLSHNKISDVGARFLADALAQNKGLKVLDLSFNPISGAGAAFIAESLRENGTLSIFRLASSRLDDAGGSALASALCDNVGLTQLDLSDNAGVRECGAGFVRAIQVNTGLKDLQLAGTGVSSVVIRALRDSRALNQEPPALRSIVPRLYRGDPDLTVADLSKKEGEYALSDSACSVLGAILHDSYVLTELNLSKNNITTRGVMDLCQGLAGNRFTLRTLNLASNAELDYEAARALCGVLRTHQALSSLDLSNNRLLDAGGLELYQFFKMEPGSSQLVDLDVRGNRMEPDLERKLTVIVQSHRCLPGLKARLMQFFGGDFRGQPDLNFSELESFVDPETPERLFDDAARVVANAVEGCTEHSSLSFRFNRLGDNGVQHLAKLFETTRALCSLDISNNRVSDEGVAHLVEMVQHRPDIGRVVLDGNKLITEDMVARLQHDMHFNRQPVSLKRLLYDIFKNESSFTTLDCSNLEGQDQITDSRLTYLCEALVRNTSIERIDLSHNHLTTDGAQLLFDTLRVATRVTSLSLRNNVLEGSAPAEALAGLLRDGASSLTAVDMSHNDLDRNAGDILLEAVTKNDSLHDLRLVGNRVPEDVRERITVALALNRELEVKRLLPRLSASDPSVSAVDFSGGRANDVSVYSLCTAMRGSIAVERFDLSGNPAVTDLAVVNYVAPLLRDNAAPLAALSLARTSCSAAGACAVLDALQTNTCLLRLDLSGNDLAAGRRVVAAAEGALHSNTTVLSINLADTGLSETDLAFIGGQCLNGQPLLRSSLPRLSADDASLTELDFSGEGGVAPTHDNVTCRLLAEAIMHNHYLTFLNLSASARIDDSGAKHLGFVLHQNVALRTLLLRKCSIGDGGAEAISDALRVNTTLTTLDLSRNRIGDPGCHALTRALTAEDGFANDVLRTCDISENGDVSEKAASALAFELTLNNGPLKLKHDRPQLRENTLTSLDYSACASDRPLNDTIVGIIAAALRDNTSVTELDLSRNSVEWNGAERVSDLLRCNTALTAVNLAHNAIGAGSTMLLDAVRRNWTLLSLNLDGNSCSDYDVERIMELVELNHHPRALKAAVMRTVDRDPSQLAITVGSPPTEEEGEQGSTKKMSDSACALLCEHLKTDCAAETLVLAWNDIGAVGAKALAVMLRVNTGITKVDLSHNRIDDEGAVALSAVFAKHPALTDVDLSHNGIGAGAVPALVDALRENSDLTHCSADGNPGFDDEALDRMQLFQTLNHKSKAFRKLLHRVADCAPGLDEVNMEGWLSLGLYDGKSVDLVAEAIVLNPGIKSLNMAFCDVTDTQLIVLSQLVAAAPHLSEINLSNNMLTSDVGCLTTALSGNRSLTSLSLRDNRIGLEGAKLIANMLRANESLMDLDLSGNTFGDVGVKIISEGVKMNDTLQQIFVEGQGVSRQAQQGLELALDVSYRSVAPAADAPADATLSPPQL